MLFFVQMKWNYQGRISQDQLWDLEALEGEHAIAGMRSGFVQLYKVVSQHRIIAIAKADSLDDLDRNSMGWLPMREYLEFEQVWALRDYEGFIDDVRAKFPPPAPPDTPPCGKLPPVKSSPEMTKIVVNRWFEALSKGDSQAALSCLDADIVWVNNPGIHGLSDIIPWLGEFHGRKAVEESFVVWGQLSRVKHFEVREVVVNGDEAFAVVHEVATIKATGLDYDIEFIQRIRVSNDSIVGWKSYWDTVQGIVPFRGDMARRLIAAAKEGRPDEAMKVLPFGANPNTIDGTSGQTILMIAAARGHVDLVKTLLCYRADPNVSDSRAGATALHKACQGGSLEVVRALVEAGAWIDQQVATTGHTPLIEAIWFKSDEAVNFLLNRGARIELKTYYGFTIDDFFSYTSKVSHGVSDGEKLGRIKESLERRRAKDRKRQEAALVLRAVHANDVSVVRQLLREGAEVDEVFPIVGGFDDGHTSLLVAARDGYTDIVRELLAAGANVNAIEPTFGAVPLHKATYNGNAEITRLLAAALSVNLNFQGPSNGYTPLHDALWHGFPECAEILLDAGARIDIVAYDGKLPIDLARESLGGAHALIKRLQFALAHNP